MQKIDDEAIQAASDKMATEAFIAQNRQFILRCASKYTHKYITDNDDEWSVAMIAFSEALGMYKAEKGSFLSFAELVIRRRLTDYLRSEYRFSGQTNVDPAVFEGQIDEESGDAVLQKAVLKQTVCEDNSSANYEIEAISAILAEYGFSFYDLTACSPKSEKTRNSSATVIRYLLEKPLLVSEMRRLRALPTKSICSGTGVPRKILERHRKYIIAAVEILYGDYPNLAEYLRYIRDYL